MFESNRLRMNHNINKSYLKRINIVIDYIEANLNEELSLELLSKKAYYSPFHFHRLFKFVTGESTNAFVNRKRIEKIAAILSVGTNEPITTLAFKYGFSSGNAFSRAFKKFYGVSPIAFKAENKISKIGVNSSSIEKYICQIDNTLNWIKMNGQIEIKELSGMQLIGMTHIGEFDKIGDNYKALAKWMATKNILKDRDLKAVTVYHDNPRITAPSKVRLSTCFTAHGDIMVEGAIKQVDIQKGHYAVGHFEISPDLFSEAWNSVCLWLLENGYEFEDGQYFEIYHNDNRTHPEHKFIVDICVPVKKPQTKSNNYNTTIEQPDNKNLVHYRKQIKKGAIQKDYKELLSYIKRLRTHFIKTYPLDYKVGRIYQGSMDFSYFPFTPISLKNQKLKIVIIFNHSKMRFEICLAGQNRQIQKKHWDLFRESNWNKYHIPETLEGFSIVDHILMEKPNFSDFSALCQQIETETMTFIKDMVDILDV